MKEILNFSNTQKIPILLLQLKGEKARFSISAKQESVFRVFLKEQKIPVLYQKSHGIPFLWRTYRHRAGLLAGIGCFFLALWLSPLFLWEIKIVGIDRLNSEDVLGLLHDEGVYVGAFSPGIDRKSVYTKVLRASEEISWLSVNIRGSTATVEIVEREPAAFASHNATGANIIAKKDGQILDMRVTRGRRIAQNNEVVQKGALLVSGIYDTGKAGTRFVQAEADVYASVRDLYTVCVPLTSVSRKYDEGIIIEESITFFNKTINIFKKCNHSKQNYDTIYRKESLPFPIFDRLPLFLTQTVAFPYTESPVTLSETDAFFYAQNKVNAEVEQAEYKEILETEENYATQDGVLTYTRQIYAIQNIAAISEFAFD